MQNYIKKLIPSDIKQIINKYLFKNKYGFFPPPAFTDMTGYEILLDAIIKQKLYLLEGDFVEIGVFLGGGTYKLSKLLEKLGSPKKVYAVDIFDPEFDNTICTQGKTMSELYKEILKNKNQYEIYKETIKDCKNINTLIGDSKKIAIPCKKISFAYIDGNHSAEYVKNDFYLVWNKIVSHGVISFDDYGYDLPQVTKTIHQLIGEQSNNILKIWTAGFKTIFIQKI